MVSLSGMTPGMTPRGGMTPMGRPGTEGAYGSTPGPGGQTPSLRDKLNINSMEEEPAFHNKFQQVNRYVTCGGQGRPKTALNMSKQSSFMYRNEKFYLKIHQDTSL